MGVEEQYAPDFLACVEGRADEVGDAYKNTYDGVTLPGFAKDGRTGASVNHMTLAAGIALFKEPNKQSVLDYWETVAEHWKENGCWFIEDGTRNTYFQWILMPSLAAVDQGCEAMREINESVWARLSLGASSEKAKFGEVMEVPEGTWKGYATTWAGARSWKYNAPHWSHLEKNTSDWVLYWAVENSTRENPGTHWAALCIASGGCPHGMSADQRDDLGGIIYGETWSLERVVAMANGCGPRDACGIVRTMQGVATMFNKSFNGNTPFLYGATFNHSTRWHGWLGHGNGGRADVQQGTAFANGEIMECVSNDGSQGPASIIYPGGAQVYKVYADKRAGVWKIEGDITEPPPPIDPPEPPVDGDALTQKERDNYSIEISKMATRQNQLAEQLANVKTYESDLEVSEQLVHQSNKASRLAVEIDGLLHD